MDCEQYLTSASNSAITGIYCNNTMQMEHYYSGTPKWKIDAIS